VHPNTVLADEMFNIEDNSTGITDLCPPHTVHPIAKISNVKNLALILSISVFSLSSFRLLSKNILSNRFLFTHNRLMRCSSSVVNPVAVVALRVLMHRC